MFRPLPDHLRRRGLKVPSGWSPPEGSPLDHPHDERPAPTLLGNPLTIPEFALRWPKELFVEEAGYVTGSGFDYIELLVEEAFEDRLPVETLQQLARGQDQAAAEVLSVLVDNVDVLPSKRLHRPSTTSGSARPRSR